MAERGDKRVDDLVAQVNNGFARIDGEIGALHAELRETRVDLRAEMREGFDRVDRQFERVDTQFDRIDRQFERVDTQFDRIDKQFERIDRQFDRIHRWAVAIAVAGLGLFGTNLIQGIGG